MSNNNDHIIFTAADIQRYLKGQMTAIEMHALEAAAMEDPFLSDAIEGYAGKIDRGETDLTNDTDKLHELIINITLSKQQKTVPFYDRQWLKIAVMLVFIAGAGILFFYISDNPEPKDTFIAKNNTSEETATKKNLTQADDLRESDTVAATDLTKSATPPETLQEQKKQGKLPPASRNSLLDSSEPQSPSAIPETRYDKMLSENDVAAHPQNEAGNKARVMTTVASPVNSFSGKVINQKSQPVPNASISVLSETKNLQVATDSNGYFKFSMPDSTASVLVNRLGYDSALVTLQGKVAGVNIMIKEMDTSASGNIIVGYSKAKAGRQLKEKTSGVVPQAEPVNGMAAFNRYIENNKKITAGIDVHGEVLVSFFVSTRGKLSDFTILKSLSPDLDKEALRLIKKGPEWKVLNNKKTKVLVNINF